MLYVNENKKFPFADRLPGGISDDQFLIWKAGHVVEPDRVRRIREKFGEKRKINADRYQPKSAAS